MSCRCTVAWALPAIFTACGSTAPPPEPTPSPSLSPRPRLVSSIEHCNTGFEPAPADATMLAGDGVFVVNSGDPSTPDDDVRDLTMPAEVIAWMTQEGWQQEHDDWHNIRRWDQGCRQSNAPAQGADGIWNNADDCAAAKRLLDRGLWRASIQEGAPGDGLAFLAMHRHMIEGIKQAFPRHESLFHGFAYVPFDREDAQNPMPWRGVSWSETQRAAIEKLENVEQHLDEFPTEDDLALYMEVPFRWTPENPSAFVSDASNGIHFQLHAQWSVANSPVNLGNGAVTLNHRVFWKLHGWLDDVWQRYRDARGLTAEDEAYQRIMIEQCEEMHALERDPAEAGGNLPAETGRFAERIRPLLDRTCVGCHSPGSAQLAVVLGPASQVRGEELVKSLVGVRSSATDLALIEPGSPERSFLFRKITHDFTDVNCRGGCGSPMPPAGDGFSAAEIELIRTWIADGAEAR